jgi:hypothetical protein
MSRTRLAIGLAVLLASWPGGLARAQGPQFQPGPIPQSRTLSDPVRSSTSVVPSEAEAKDVAHGSQPPCPCGWKAIIYKIVHPSSETIRRTRYCYDYHEYDFARTCGLKTPIPTTRCPECDKCPPEEYPDLECVRYGPPHCRRVLVKKIIVEEVKKPRAVVERQVECVPGKNTKEPCPSPAPCEVPGPCLVPERMK